MGLFTKWRNKEELTSARMNRMLDEIESKLNELNQAINSKVEILPVQVDNVSILSNPSYLKSYITCGNPATMQRLVNINSWAHIIFLHHYGGDGYGAQIMMFYGDNAIQIRTASGTSWGPLRRI